MMNTHLSYRFYTARRNHPLYMVRQKGKATA
jgi:hypothetical protein